MCATVLGAFLVWFTAQTSATKRAVVKERALGWVDHPLLVELIAACPPDVQEPAERLREAVRRSRWID
jgi:hypothetical protein